MKGALLRALVGGSVATAVGIGLSLAIGVFTVVEAVAFGLFMAAFFAVLPYLPGWAGRNAKPS